MVTRMEILVTENGVCQMNQQFLANLSVAIGKLDILKHQYAILNVLSVHHPSYTSPPTLPTPVHLLPTPSAPTLPTPSAPRAPPSNTPSAPTLPTPVHPLPTPVHQCTPFLHHPSYTSAPPSYPTLPTPVHPSFLHQCTPFPTPVHPPFLPQCTHPSYTSTPPYIRPKLMYFYI